MSTHQNWLLYCRPSFEADCAQEALRQAKQQRPIIGTEQPATEQDSGYVQITLNEQKLSYKDLIFARQLIRLEQRIDALPERDRLTPLLAAIAKLPHTFGALWLEVADTNDGKTVSAFTRRFQPLLETALREQGKLQDLVENTVRPEPDGTTSHSTKPASGQVAGYVEGQDAINAQASTSSARTEKEASYKLNHLPRLHVFFPDKSTALIGTSDPYNSSASLMGIHRQNMPAEAPSRSTLKLAEAIEVFMDKGEQSRLLRAGMTAVDLGAAPGGWTWQMVKRGIRVSAIDNGPMKGVLAKHPLVEHLRQDGFKFAPRKAVDWLICDMVEKPAKVADLMAAWFVAGWCKHAIFNLKLPMKQHLSAVDSALGSIRKKLDEEGINYRMTAKQLYHDREEITVFFTKTKG